MLKTFPIGGVHPPGNKISAAKAIERFPVPESVVIPLAQHIGAPAVSCVAKGDKVLAGQIIAKANGFVSSNIHSSVSGTVKSVDTFVDAQGLSKQAVTITVEGDEWAEGIDLSDTLVEECNLEPKTIIEKISAAGIVGMGGATFPTQVKLSVPAGSKAECLIINGVECEPFLTADHRLMLEKGAEVLVGAKIIAKALGVTKIYVGIENNKPDAIDSLKRLAPKYGAEIVPLKVQYPQGGEKQLIAAVTGRQVPSKGLPIAVGAVVQNAGTAFAVYEAVQKNKPLVERVVTVTGKSLKDPKNLLVRIGTPISSLLAYCGGEEIEGDVKVIGGGPMMGRAMSNIEAPVQKGSSGILVLAESETKRGEESDCIRCAKCVAACPMGLEPYMLGKLAKKKLYDMAEEYYIYDCIECGCCTFSCPANIPLLDWIHIGKADVMKIMKARSMK